MYLSSAKILNQRNRHRRRVEARCGGCGKRSRALSGEVRTTFTAGRAPPEAPSVRFSPSQGCADAASPPYSRRFLPRRCYDRQFGAVLSGEMPCRGRGRQGGLRTQVPAPERPGTRRTVRIPCPRWHGTAPLFLPDGAPGCRSNIFRPTKTKDSRRTAAYQESLDLSGHPAARTPPRLATASMVAPVMTSVYGEEHGDQDNGKVQVNQC